MGLAYGNLPPVMKTTAHAALLALLLPISANAQTPPAEPGFAARPLSLPAAIDAALSGNTAHAVAQARREIANRQAVKAGAPLWPQVTVQAGYLSSVDPVVTFGTKLRQGVFAQPDFALESLNDPDPIDDWSSSISVSWSLLDPTRWAGRASARRQADAAAWSAERSREATVLITRTLYHRSQSAEAQLQAARAAEDAAAATLDAFRKRRDRGLLTEADLLQAEAELAAALARRTEAERIRIDALQELGRQLGWSPDTLPAPTDTLAAPGPLGEREFQPAARADLRALAAVSAAASAAKRQAVLNWVPALDAFAQYTTHSPDAFAFDEDDWTVGLALRWTLFSGFGRTAEVQRAGLEQRIAGLEYAQAIRDARREIDQAERAVRSARLQVEATRAAAEASASGRDLMRRRFDEGLATAADLLQAESRATAMRQGAIGALANYHTAVARFEFARSQSNQRTSDEVD